jgi:hypothetical protein
MKSSFGALVVALLILAGSGAVLGAAYLYVVSESATAAELAAKLSDKKAESKRVGAIAAAREELKGDEALINNYFISESNIVSFLTNLQNRGSALGSTVTIGSVGGDKAKTLLTIALSIAGPFDAVMRTLGSIEYAPYSVVQWIEHRTSKPAM